MVESKVGSAVTKFKAGDLAAVGCLVDSDGSCPDCQTGLEQFCPNLTLTYNSPDPHLGGVTYGGYSDSIVVKDHFVLHVPPNLNLAGVAPLLCAGITTYSPLRHWSVTNGKKVGVVGLGGLGHMAVKFAHALGAYVVVFTTSQNKKDDAVRLGADEVIVSTDAVQMKKHTSSFDFILDTVSAEHNITPTSTTSPRWKHNPCRCARQASRRIWFWASVPAPQHLWFDNRRSSRNTGNARLCGRHNITADVEVIPIQKVNEAYDRLLKSDVKYHGFLLICIYQI